VLFRSRCCGIVAWLGLLAVWHCDVSWSPCATGPTIPGTGRQTRSRTRTKKSTVAVEQKRIFALLIDGDVAGPSMWSPAIEAIRERGTLHTCCVFASPGECDSPKHGSTCAELGIKPMPVPRKTGGSKDQNDIAISMEAGILASQGFVTSIALLATDYDFVYLAHRLRKLGLQSVFIFVEGGYVVLADCLQQAGADIVWIKTVGGGVTNRASRKMLLHACRQHTIERLDNVHESIVDTSALVGALLSLRYMDALDDPLLPAIAKFYHVNQLGPLTVFPATLAIREAVSLISSAVGQPWSENPGLAFVLPMCVGKLKSEAILEKYGSRQCAQYCEGGGPFLLRSGPMLVDEVLTRLGFLDSGLNADFGEAVVVCSKISHNFQVLRTLGISISADLDASSKRALMCEALLASRSRGTWTLPPSDKSLRKLFVSRKLIKNPEVPIDDVHSALQQYSKTHGLPAYKTYNALVQSVERHYSGQRDPRFRQL